LTERVIDFHVFVHQIFTILGYTVARLLDSSSVEFVWLFFIEENIHMLATRCVLYPVVSLSVNDVDMYDRISDSGG